MKEPQSRQRIERLRQAADNYLEGAINERHLASALGTAAAEIDAAVAAAEPAGEDAGIVDNAQRSGASNGRGRGYALTERGRRRAECLRQASDSGASTSNEASAARSAVASVSGATFPGVRRSGNATTPAREASAEGCSDTVSKAAFPAVGESGNATAPAGEASAARSAVASVSAVALPAVAGNGNATMPAREVSAEGCSDPVSAAAFPAVGGSGNATTPAGEVSAARSAVASVSGGAGHVGDEMVGDERAEPARRRSCTRRPEDLLLRLFRPHGASEPRLMFRTVLTLFRLSGQSVEAVSPAFNRLVADGFLHQVPSQYYPEPLYALTDRGRQRVAGSKGATVSQLP